jgi:hypothetical protein
MKRVLGLGTLLVAATALGGSHGPRDSSGPSRTMPIWRDAEGRILAKMVSSRMLLLYTWDSGDRVVRIDARTGRFDLRSRTTPSDGEHLWTHCFLYSDGGNLAGEHDCKGEFHELDPRGRHHVDLDRGTALVGHRHGHEAPTSRGASGNTRSASGPAVQGPTKEERGE